jgi:hypothetical protein
MLCAECFAGSTMSTAVNNEDHEQRITNKAANLKRLFRLFALNKNKEQQQHQIPANNAPGALCT